MVPVIALVGRPNVGKSTMFNRLTKTRDAIVGDLSGLTRDRQYGDATWQGRSYILIDTGGITGDEVGMDEKMAEQSLMAIEEADYVLFPVDARAGMTAADQMIAEHLRKRNKEAIRSPTRSTTSMRTLPAPSSRHWAWVMPSRSPAPKGVASTP